MDPKTKLPARLHALRKHGPREAPKREPELVAPPDPSKRVWKTLDGSSVAVADMEYSHLSNAIRHVESKYASWLAVQLKSIGRLRLKADTLPTIEAWEPRYVWLTEEKARRIENNNRNIAPPVMPEPRTVGRWAVTYTTPVTYEISADYNPMSVKLAPVRDYFEEGELLTPERWNDMVERLFRKGMSKLPEQHRPLLMQFSDTDGERLPHGMALIPQVPPQGVDYMLRTGPDGGPRWNVLAFENGGRVLHSIKDVTHAQKCSIRINPAGHWNLHAKRFDSNIGKTRTRYRPSAHSSISTRYDKARNAHEFEESLTDGSGAQSCDISAHLSLAMQAPQHRSAYWALRDDGMSFMSALAQMEKLVADAVALENPPPQVGIQRALRMLTVEGGSNGPHAFVEVNGKGKTISGEIAVSFALGKFLARDVQPYWRLRAKGHSPDGAAAKLEHALTTVEALSFGGLDATATVALARAKAVLKGTDPTEDFINVGTASWT